MCSFSIILTCFHYLNFIISTAILCYSYCYVQVSDLILCISALISHIFLISTQISCILKLTSCIPTLILQIFFIPFPNFPFQLLERERERQRQRKRETKRERERELPQFVIFQNLFSENSYFSSKANTLSPYLTAA